MKIGSKLVKRLRGSSHEVLSASPTTVVDTIAGAGLAQALAGADVVVDVADSPSYEDNAALEFFDTSGRNLMTAEAAAGVRHHVALSVVGTDRNPEISHHDRLPVISDVHARYFGGELNDKSFTPGDKPRIGPTRFEDWLSQQKVRVSS